MRKIRMASSKHAAQMDFASMHSGFRSLNDLILRVDPFKLSPTTGARFAVCFYAVFFGAVLSVTLAIALTVIPGTAPEDVLKSELLAVHSNWLYARKKQ